MSNSEFAVLRALYDGRSVKFAALNAVLTKTIVLEMVASGHIQAHPDDASVAHALPLYVQFINMQSKGAQSHVKADAEDGGHVRHIGSIPRLPPGQR